MKQWQLDKINTILLMIPLVSAYSFSLDLYIPLLPTIQHALEVSRFDMQLTNSLFMLACCVGQLIFGPLSDRYGRRRMLFLSLIISISANILCMYANSYLFFLLGKILQAVGACGTYLSCFASIRDLYHHPEKSAEMFSYLNIANSVSAINAPSIGTQLGRYFGWTSIFMALAIYAGYAVVTCYLLYQETAPRLTGQKNTPEKHFLSNYYYVFTHINYQVYTLPAALGVGSYFAYYSISPYLYQQTFGLSKETYSIYYGSCGLTFFMSSYFCSQLVRRLGIVKTLSIGMILHGFGCLGVIISFICLGSFKLACMHLAVMCIIAGSALMVNAGIGGTMAPFASIAGSAFALVSAYKFAACYGLGELSMAIYDNTPIPMATMLLGINLIACLIIWLYRNQVVCCNPKNKHWSALSEAAAKNIDNIV